MPLNIFKVVIPLVLTFLFGIALTPSLSRMMYKHRLWKRSNRGSQSENPGISKDFSNIHNSDQELSTPRIGGIIIWLAVLCNVIVIWVMARIFPIELIEKLEFVSRSQTWLPLFALIVASLIGLVDDLLQIFGAGKAMIDGIPRWQRIGVIFTIGLVGALWFFFQLDVSAIFVPFFGQVSLGWLFVPFFIMVVLATFSGGVIDGIDGLSGGVLASAFAAYAVIAFMQNQLDLAALSASLTGGILAFLWFNVPPARFYMAETGMMGLTVTLALVAFFTDQVLLLPIIAFPLVATSGSVILQKIARKFFHGKKVFKVSPLHHHFQAIGWSNEKIVMRYWIISLVCAMSGIIIALIG